MVLMHRLLMMRWTVLGLRVSNVMHRLLMRRWTVLGLRVSNVMDLRLRSVLRVGSVCRLRIRLYRELRGTILRRTRMYGMRGVQFTIVSALRFFWRGARLRVGVIDWRLVACRWFRSCRSWLVAH
jgi:hypothetical protein